MDEIKQLLSSKRYRSFKEYESTFNNLEIRNEINFSNTPNHKLITKHKCKICNLFIESSCYTLQCGHKFHYDCAIEKHEEIIKENALVRKESFHSNHSFNMTEDKSLFCYLCNEKDINIYHKENVLNNWYYLVEEIHELIEFNNIYDISCDCLVFLVNLWATYAMYFVMIRVLYPSLYYAITESLISLFSLT